MRPYYETKLGKLYCGVCEKLGIKYTGIDLDLQYAIPRIEQETKQLKLFP